MLVYTRHSFQPHPNLIPNPPAPPILARILHRQPDLRPQCRRIILIAARSIRSIARPPAPACMTPQRFPTRLDRQTGSRRTPTTRRIRARRRRVRAADRVVVRHPPPKRGRLEPERAARGRKDASRVVPLFLPDALGVIVQLQSS